MRARASRKEIHDRQHNVALMKFVRLPKYIRRGHIRQRALAFVAQPYRFALVTGCPRSGTTALVKWLSQQKGVSAFSETRILVATHEFLQAFDRLGLTYAKRPSLIRTIRGTVSHYYAARMPMWGQLVVDKEPLEPIAFPDLSYKDFIEHVRLLIPETKFVLMIRHPVATVWSMRNRTWNSKWLSLEECIRIWKDNAAVISSYTGHPNVYVCRFEDLVSRPGDVSAAILRFLGVRNGSPFVPAPTKEAALTHEEDAEIIAQTLHERAALGY